MKTIIKAPCRDQDKINANLTKKDWPSSTGIYLSINIYIKSTPPPRVTYFESFLGVPVHTHVTRHFLAPPCPCLRLRGNKKEANHQVVQLSGSDYRDLHTCWNNIYIYGWKYNNRKTILLKEISDRFFMSQCLTVWILH